MPNFTVRRGKLVYRGNNDEGRPIYEQKRVDVALATDLVMHATKRLISHAVLITGQNKSTHDELLDIVDIRKLITQDMIDSIKR